jgi:hypothetical protein
MRPLRLELNAERMVVPLAEARIPAFIGSSNWTGPMQESTMVTENLVDRFPLDPDDRLAIRSVRVVEI